MIALRPLWTSIPRRMRFSLRSSLRNAANRSPGVTPATASMVFACMTLLVGNLVSGLIVVTPASGAGFAGTSTSAFAAEPSPAPPLELLTQKRAAHTREADHGPTNLTRDMTTRTIIEYRLNGKSADLRGGEVGLAL